MLATLYLFLLLVMVAAWRELRPASVERRRQAQLEVLEPARASLAAGERIGVVSGATVGRGRTSHVRIDEESISTRHAVIRQERGRWWVDDLNSTNGTYLNGVRVSGSAPLQSGDVLQVGRVSARFLV